MKGACQWLAMGHLLQDLYHARLIQDLHTIQQVLCNILELHAKDLPSIWP